MSSAPTAAEIARDATWFVQALDPAAGKVRLMKMDPQAYRDASFLDDRMMQQPREAYVVPWSEIGGAVTDESRRDARWIFHIGHVGSTLVARLLGEIAGVLSIREPRFLRDVAVLPKERRGDFTPAAQALYSRTFGVDELALVKATSFVSEIAGELVPERQRALFMYAQPRNYIASILAGPNSVQELAALAPSRTERMSGRLDLPQPRTTAEAAAAAWACEMTALESAAETMTDRQVAWADFDFMLTDMAAELERAAAFFGFATDDIDAIATGPLMGRYSKATEYEYTPSLRHDLIGQADGANRADIDSALAMLQSAAQNSPLLGRALRRAECTESSSS
jgi:hypothetical protein